jgi:hypothetical protein
MEQLEQSSRKQENNNEGNLVSSTGSVRRSAVERGDLASSTSTSTSAQQQLQQQLQQAAGAVSLSTSTYSAYNYIPLANRAPSRPARRHLSQSSSLSSVTNYAEGHGETDGEDNDDDKNSNSRESLQEHQSPRQQDAAPSTDNAGKYAQNASPKRPVASMTRSDSGLPLAWEPAVEPLSSRESSTNLKGHHASIQAHTAAPPSSGIAQQRPHALTTLPPAMEGPLSPNITQRRNHSSNIGSAPAYSPSSPSSVASSSSSPLTGYYYAPGSTRLEGGVDRINQASSDIAASPATSVGTAPSLDTPTKQQHTTAQATSDNVGGSLPIAILSSSQLANVGIGISTGRLSETTSSAISSPLSAPALASAPATTTAPIPLAIGGALSSSPASSVQNRLSSTVPFLPSPLAQASLAPGEEEGEHMEMFGLDSALLDAEDGIAAKKSPTIGAGAIGLVLSPRDRPGRPLGE